MKRTAAFVLLLTIGVLPASSRAQTGAASDDVEVAVQSTETAESAEVVRTTLAPWSVDVLGRNYDNFDNDDASIVLNDWLINALMAVPVFNVVNRDKIQAALSEQQLVSSGYAEDVSTTALADAGKILKVNYILLGNFKNLGQTTEIDFKLLDVDTATYSLTLNFTVPFNPSLEAVKPEVDRVVAALSEEFPIVSEILEIEDLRRLRLVAGSEAGVAEDMEALIVARDSPETVLGRGWVVSAGVAGSVVELEEETPQLSLFDHVARVKVVPPAQAALNRAQRALREGHLDEAAESFAKGLEIDPRDGQLQAGHARTHHRRGDYERALPSFRQAIALQPDDEELLDDAARAFFEGGEFQQLLDLVGEAPRTPAMAVLVGRVRGANGQVEKAEQMFKAALKLDPASLPAHLHQGLALLRAGAKEEAVRELRLAAEMGRDDPLAVWVHGLASGESVDEPEGLSFDDLSLGAEVHLALGDEHAEKALALARRSLEGNPVFLMARLLEARALTASGSRADAIAVMKQALESHPDNYAVQWQLARELIASERWDEGLEALNRAADLASDDWRPAKLEGDVQAARNRHLEAAGAYQDALQRAETAESDDLVEILYGLGRSLTAASQHSRALPHLERCVALAPAHEECHYNLGLGYFAVGTPEADERALRAFQAAEGIAERHYYLAVLWERRQEIEQAAEAYRACIRAGCEREPESRQRLDEIETIGGKVLSKKGGKDLEWVTLSVGAIHGVKHGMRAVVVASGEQSRLEVEQVDETTCVARVERGSALVGQAVRFRPSRPRGLTARAHEKKGVQLSWRRNPEAEVDHYLVYRSDHSGGRGVQIGRVKSRESQYRDRKVEEGRTYTYSVVAMSDLGMRSLPSDEVEFRGP